MVIDRFEGEYAVCEDENGQMIKIPRAELPPGAREGSVLRREADHFLLDEQETRARMQRIRERMAKLWKKS